MKHFAMKVATALAVSVPAIVGTTALAAPASAQPAVVQTAAVSTATVAPSDVASARAVILAETNAARAAAGVAPLAEVGFLDDNAQACSETQAANGVMAHCVDFYTRYPAGWTSAAENVAYGQSVEDVVDAWLASPGHRANILNPALTHIGIGSAVGANGLPYYTQNFAGYPA